MELYLLKYTFVLYRRQFNEKNPFTLEVEKNFINKCERQYQGKKCQCVVSEIFLKPNKQLNFPDEEDHNVHVQFENAQTHVYKHRVDRVFVQYESISNNRKRQLQAD